MPRVYEKFEAHIRTMVQTKWKPTSQQIFKWAQKKGAQFTDAQIKGDLAPFGYNLSRLLALESVRRELGL